MKDVSASGRWRRGQTYIPDQGPCKGHVVKVLNPEIVALQKGTYLDGPNKGQEVVTPMPSVIVRCMDCFRSWSFSEAVEIEEQDGE